MKAFVATERMATSESHPIRVDWLPTSEAGPGRVGLTFAPGKKATSSIYGGPGSNRDLAADLARLRDVYGAQVLACLLEDEEFERIYIPDYLAQTDAHGFDVLRLPIEDGDVPTDGAAAVRFVRTIDERFARGQRVVIHCRGGLGRAGTIGALWLRLRGLDAEAALREVATARQSPHCPETLEQCDFVRSTAIDR